MTKFKIRRKSDGLYSTGGTTPGFHPDGKVWNKLGHVRSHLSGVYDFVSSYGRDNPYIDCELVEFELVETNALDLKHFINDTNKKREEREAASKQWRLEWQQRQEEKEFQRLKEKLGK